MAKFEDTTHYKEIVLRGTYLSIATNVDWILLFIIGQIFQGHEQDLENMYDTPLNKFTLWDKIGCVEIGLVRYHTSFYITHINDFKQLQELRNMRNKFGHGHIDWINESTGELTISMTSAAGIQKQKYLISDLMKQLIEYRNSIMKFLDTLKSISPDLQTEVSN